MSYQKNSNDDRKDPKDQKDASETSSKDKRSNYRGKPRNNRKGSGDAKVTDDTKKLPGDYNALNDIAWYTKYPTLADAASRVQFLNRPGDFLGDGGFGTNDAFGRSIPGVMRIEYQAALGSSSDNSSPASICAKGIYDKIRDAYSGTLHADPPDIFMYMMHLDQFQAYIAWLKRIYGVLNYYTPFNHYAPYTLFRAMFPNTVQNINEAVFFNWVSHKNDLLYYINQLVYMCNKYVVPSDMAIFDRHRWMNENVYRDVDSVLSQLYVFAPKGFWCVNGVDVSDGTECNFIGFTSSSTPHDDQARMLTTDDAFEFGVRMYKALADWGDAKTINGYIMRAFDGQFYPPCELMPADYIVRPVYALEVLLQIHNLRIFNSYIEKKWRQNAATGAIIVDNSALNHNMRPAMIDIPADIPDQGSIIIATRLAPVVTGSIEDGSIQMHTGTEVVTGLWMSDMRNRTDSASRPRFIEINNFNITNALDGDPDDATRRMENVVQPLWAIAQYSAYAMAPFIDMKYFEVGDGASAANAMSTSIGEISNATLVENSVMARLHLTCQQSEFNIYNARTA